MARIDHRLGGTAERGTALTPERIAWHAFTLGVLALLLLVLLVSVRSLREAPAPVGAAPGERAGGRVAAPIRVPVGAPVKKGRAEPRERPLGREGPPVDAQRLAPTPSPSSEWRARALRCRPGLCRAV